MHGAHHDTHAGMHPMRACNTCRTHAALVNVEVGAERSAAARKACDEPKKCASTLKNAKGSVAQKNSSCSGVAMSLPRDKPSREAREAQRRRPPPSSARANRRAGAAAATAAAIVDDHLRVGGAPTEASPEQRDDVHVLALAERHRRVVAPSRRKPARLATRGRPQASEADSPATATSHENRSDLYYTQQQRMQIMQTCMESTGAVRPTPHSVPTTNSPLTLTVTSVT